MTNTSILNKGKLEILLMSAMCYQQALLELGGEKLEADAKKSCRLSMSYPMVPLPALFGCYRYPRPAPASGRLISRIEY